MTNLLPTPAMGFPDPSPAMIECPIDFERHKLACFQFSSHSSYEEAKIACESVGARLADIEPTHGKYVVDRVRSMGGNDFWIGSFINRGRVYRQKGRTSCPIMRGQVINDALYDLVNCNSANRFVCQKHGPDNKARNFDSRNKVASAATSTVTTTEISQETGGSSPVLYIVITVLILIAILASLKLLRSKYLRNKRKKKDAATATKNAKKEVGKGIVFTPKRKGEDSKRTSIDSAVPPSNISFTSEKHLSAALPPNGMNETSRPGRPRVNGPRPTRQPPGISENCPEDIYSRSNERTRRRHHSDPRSNNGEIHRQRRNSRQYYHSDYSDSVSSSDSDDDTSHSGHAFGPQKVYQRQSSRAPMTRDHYRHEMRSNFYSPSRRARKHDGHQFIENRHTSKYHDDLEDDCDYDYQSDSDIYHKGRSGYYRQGNDTSNMVAKNKRVPTVSANLPQHQTHGYGMAQAQYFPQPHRLVSWTNLAELNDFSFQAMRPADEPPKSFPREPIRVRRKIHQQRASLPRMPNLETNGPHLYESLKKKKRPKNVKKKTKKSKSRQSHKERKMKRTDDSRASVRSISSIQSRKLPTPPLV